MDSTQSRSLPSVGVCRDTAKHAVLVAAAVLVTGCFQHRPLVVTTAEPRGTATLQQARITTAGGERLILHAVSITADSVVGTRIALGSSSRIALAADQVERIEARQVDTGRTVLAVLGSTILVGVAALAHGMSTLR